LGYIEKKLNKGEQILLQTELHPIIFTMPFVVIAAGVLVINILNQIYFEHKLGHYWVAVIGLLFFIPEAIRYITSVYGITTERIIARTGVLRLRIIEMPLEKVETVSVNQSILGRMLDYGAVTITGTGGAREFLADLRTPGQFKDAIMQKLQKI
jgi:uncharacterized membrane protein YdbT with pleckstrin-like domain